jgi:hypothetical protein
MKFNVQLPTSVSWYAPGWMVVAALAAAGAITAKATAHKSAGMDLLITGDSPLPVSGAKTAGPQERYPVTDRENVRMSTGPEVRDKAL